MNITIAAGKGGVGKSTTIGSFALGLAAFSYQTLAIDLDGGYALSRVLALNPDRFKPNLIQDTDISNLKIAPVRRYEFENILDVKNQGGTVQDYLNQFEDEYGILAFCDMITTFFGVPTDVDNTAKFISLSKLLRESSELGLDEVLIDIEPTQGLERLLGSIHSVQRSITNLQGTGLMTLTALGTKWPDIKTFLRGEYIKKGIYHADNMGKTIDMLKNSDTYLICKPDKSSVDQMLNEVTDLISTLGSTVRGYVINDIREEDHEPKQIERVEKISGSKEVSLFKFPHDLALCEGGAVKRREALRQYGYKIHGERQLSNP